MIFKPAIGTLQSKSVRILLAAAMAGIAAILFLALASDSSIAREQKSGPVLRDAELAVEIVAEGLESPTSMAFLGDGSIMVLEKGGQVRLVSDWKLLEEPVLEVDVADEVERGLLGIAIWQDENDASVFLYLTETDGQVRNRVYKHDWDGNSLVSRTMILDLPGEPGPFHNGGKIAIGPDGHLYAVIGDVNAGGGMLDNQIPGRPLDDKSVVLRVDRDTGMGVEDNPFYSYGGELEKLQRYYAYGIRNSFGMDFDPATGKLWMTENGPDAYDEINIVEPGFNSGWHKVMGPISRTDATMDDIIVFNGSRYQDPVFSWRSPIGVTDIEFFDSAELGEKYENNVFVGDINNGNMYFFEINEVRDGLELKSSGLDDMVADPIGDDLLAEASPAIIGERLGRITDIETGPDGYLYVLSYEDGKIYRIVKQA
jgi:glucose/arabinose dehydrogenase